MTAVKEVWDLLLLLSFDLRNESHYFYQQKWVYSKEQRIAIQDELAMEKAIGKFNKGEDHYFIEKKEEVKRGCLKKSPLEQSEISCDDSFSLASCWSSQFLIGNGIYVSLLGLVINYPFLLMIYVLWPVIHNSSCDSHRVVLHERSLSNSVLVRSPFINFYTFNSNGNEKCI